MDEHPERAGPALAAIKDASRQAIADVHALVAALRTTAAVPTAPTPGIADLDALVGSARATGLTVSTSVAGPTRPVPAVVDVAAARVIQESLTNVVRHSLATSAAVTVTSDRAALTVSVDDDGPPRDTASMSGGGGHHRDAWRPRALGGRLFGTSFRATDSRSVPGSRSKMGVPMTIRVVVADDQALVRAGFVALLDAQGDIGAAPVAEADTGARALAAAREHRPDVVPMDIRMPELDGLAATRAIAGDPALAGVRVVVRRPRLRTRRVRYSRRCARAPSGFLVKHTEPAELLRAVRVVADGEALLWPSVSSAAGAPVSRASPSARLRHGHLSELTSREREVMALVAEGLTNAEIGDRLYLSPATAHTHVSRILTKLDARDRTQLVVLAYESGLVRPGWRE